MFKQADIQKEFSSRKLEETLFIYSNIYKLATIEDLEFTIQLIRLFKLYQTQLNQEEIAHFYNRVLEKRNSLPDYFVNCSEVGIKK